MQRNIIEYLSVFLFIAVSGGQYFFLLKGAIFVPLFFMMSLFINYNNNRNLRFEPNASTMFGILSLLFMTVHYFIIYPDHVGNMYISVILFFIASYYFVSAFTFERFRHLYLNILSIMALVSIVVFFLVQIGLVTPTLYHKGDSYSLLYFYHMVGFDSVYSRLCGIFWEPGAYQIVLNMSFLFYFRDIINRQLTKQQILKFVIISFALILTQSTAGYLVLSLIFVYYCYLRFLRDGFSVKLMFIVISSAFVIFALINSPVVQDKFGQVGHSGTSYEIRKADNLAMLYMIKERPLIGYGLDSRERANKSLILDNQTSSNGTLSFLSQYGIPFYLFYLFGMYKGISRIYTKKETFIILPFFLFMTAFEVYWYFPLALVFLCSFKDNRMKSITTN